MEFLTYAEVVANTPSKQIIRDANLSLSRRTRTSEGGSYLRSPEAAMRFDGEKMLDG